MRITQRSLKDLAAEEIRARIFRGELRPGERVNQDRVAEELGVSKLPVREALITLDGEGLVRMIARRGAFVAPLTREDVLDHYHLFGIVAGVAAERAAEQIATERLADLALLVEEMETAHDRTRHEELNEAFHRTINQAGQSRRLAAVLKLLATSLPSGFFDAHLEWSRTANDDHRRILAALERRDPEAARHEVSEHLRRSGQLAVRRLESVGFWTVEPVGQPLEGSR